MCPSWPKEHDWKSCKSLTRLLGFESPHLRHRRHKLHIACGDFLLSFYRKSPRTHCAAPPLPKKLTLFGDPDICFCCKDRDSNRAIRRIETVHRTVSAKFINEFGASCLLCFAQFTPLSKRRKAPKMAWTRCPSHFFTIPSSATSCTHRLTCRFGRCFCTLCRGLHRRPAPFTREAKRFI